MGFAWQVANKGQNQLIIGEPYKAHSPDHCAVQLNIGESIDELFNCLIALGFC